MPTPQEIAICLLTNPIYPIIFFLLIYHDLAIMDWYNQVPNFNSGNDASSRPLTGSTNDDWVLAGQHSILQGVQPTPAFPSVPSCAPFGQTIGSGDW